MPADLGASGPEELKPKYHSFIHSFIACWRYGSFWFYLHSRCYGVPCMSTQL